MRVQRVLVRRNREPIAEASVRAAIDAASDVELLILTGEEPVLAPALGDFVAYAKQRCRRVALETDAKRIDGELARSLAAAGLDVAHVRLVSVETAGMKALCAAGIAMEVIVDLARSNLAKVAALPEEIVAELGGDHGVSIVRVGVPLEGRARELVSYPEAARVIEELYARARLAHIPIGLADDGVGLPPCSFAGGPPPGLYDDVASKQGQGFVRLPPCEDCSANDRCPGISSTYLRSRPAHDLHPLAAPRRSARALPTMTGDREQVQRLLVRREGDRCFVRVSFVCDQSCTFCSVPTQLPTPDDALVRAAIESAGDAEIVLTGGEPALNPRLLDYVRLAGGHVAIETNGVAFADPVFADAIRDAGLKRARVGLHGSDESISASITRAPGTWAKTLLGLDHLHQRSIELTIAIRLCAANVDDVERIVTLARTRWPGSAIEIAPVIDDDRHAVPHDALISLLERLPSEVAITACLPPCVSRRSSASVVDGVKVAACLRCRRESECGGVPRAYAERYGIATLAPET